MNSVRVNSNSSTLKIVIRHSTGLIAKLIYLTQTHRLWWEGGGVRKGSPERPKGRHVICGHPDTHPSIGSNPHLFKYFPSNDECANVYAFDYCTFKNKPRPKLNTKCFQLAIFYKLKSEYQSTSPGNDIKH